MPLRGEYGQQLTAHEVAIVQLFADGKTGKEIAGQLHCGTQSIKNHIVVIGLRLAVHRTPAIVAECMRRKLVK